MRGRLLLGKQKAPDLFVMRDVGGAQPGGVVVIEKGTGLYLIPAGTQPSACGSCGYPIYWIDHTRKPRNKVDRPVPRPLPISLKHVLAVTPTRTTFGRGISHFADCPNAAQHRKFVPQRLELVS